MTLPRPSVSTKSERRETRWMLLDQRISFLEQRTDERLVGLDKTFREFKTEYDNDRISLKADFGELRAEVGKKICDTHDKIEDLQKIIYKAVGAMGAVLAIIEVILRIVK